MSFNNRSSLECVERNRKPLYNRLLVFATHPIIYACTKTMSGTSLFHKYLDSLATGLKLFEKEGVMVALEQQALKKCSS